MPGFPNKFPGRCAECGDRVAAQAGVTEKVSGRWLVYCPSHSRGAMIEKRSTAILGREAPASVHSEGIRSRKTLTIPPQPIIPLRDRDDEGNYLLLSGHTASPYQAAVFDHFQSGTGSRIIRAVAGSGKTTTMKNAIRFLPEFTTVQMLAFNTEAAKQLKEAIAELQQRTGRSFAFVEADTFHSVGLRALRRYLNLPNSAIKVKSTKTRWLFKDKLWENPKSTLLRNQSPEYIEALYSSFVCKLVNLAKGEGLGALFPNTRAEWQRIIDHHGLYFDTQNAETDHAIDLAQALLEWSNEAAKTGSLDHADMLYLICLWNIALIRHAVVICDEAQDTNPVRRAFLHLLLADNGRLYAVGDERQSIYGFTGASTDAMELIKREFNAKELPLTVCYRCAQSIVKTAQTWVNYIEPTPTAPEGLVDNETPLSATIAQLHNSDAILCRNTAPLVSVAYRLIASGRGCRILGREIGQGLVNLVEQQKAGDLDDLETSLNAWAERETTKFIKRGEEDRADQVMDRVQCIQVVIDNLVTGERDIETLCAKLSSMFDDSDSSLLTLCTVHKAKGKEWPRVAILRPELMPSKSARQAWQLEQETNLCYVAATRAKEHLIYVAASDMSLDGKPVPSKEAEGSLRSAPAKVNLADLL